MAKVLSIGEAARLAGVSVQTLRHYDKLGLLTPSHASAAGHRRYSEQDCERLTLIRALREVGFDLDMIGRVLDSAVEPGEAVEIRLEALEAEQRALRRRQLLLRAAMNGDRKGMLGRLQEKHVLARLDRLEREAFLARHLEWVPHDTPESQAVWHAAVFDLPEEMDDAQLEAWLELAEIAVDERFHRTLQRQFEFFQGADGARALESNRSFQRLLTHVARASQEKRRMDDDTSRTLLDAWLDDFARLHARTPGPELTRWLLDSLERCHDPLIERYWQLICTLKHVPYDPAFERAFTWVVSALRLRAASPGGVEAGA